MPHGPILLVEDHADTRQIVEEYLTFQGFDVVAAENGLAGLAALQLHRPCLILLDLTMPVMDGWRFREEQLRLADGRLARTPVIVLSALAEAVRHADTLGAVGRIAKAIDFDHMVDVVRSHCMPEA